MKRSGFKPRWAPRPAKRMDDYTPAPMSPHRAVYAASEADPIQVPKRRYARSRELLQACRLLPCQHCGAQDDTVVAAHSNWGVHGKGRGIKADDTRVAALCSICHHQMDQGFLWDAPTKRAHWWAAHCKTVRLLSGRRLWPEGLALPDISANPFVSN
jgi:hypothetical protein